MQLQNLKTKFLGRNNIYYKEIDSTQKEIWRLSEKNETKNGTLVMTDIQTNGIGTHGRIWHTDEKNNIAFSFLVKPQCNIKDLEGITLEIAETIVGVFKTKYKIDINIKKPNDLIINNKKVGGILTETKLVSQQVKFLVIGIGINTQKEKFTEDIQYLATSIKKEFNININAEEFISEFCNKFEEKLIKRIGD